MKTPQEMRNGVMEKVYRVYLLRQIARPAIRIGLFGLACLLLAGFVSIPNVIENASQTGNILAFLRFAFVAFVGTQLIVQVAVVIGAVVVGATLRDFVLALRGPERALAGN